MDLSSPSIPNVDFNPGFEVCRLSTPRTPQLFHPSSHNNHGLPTSPPASECDGPTSSTNNQVDTYSAFPASAAKHNFSQIEHMRPPTPPQSHNGDDGGHTGTTNGKVGARSRSNAEDLQKRQERRVAELRMRDRAIALERRPRVMKQKKGKRKESASSISKKGMGRAKYKGKGKEKAEVGGHEEENRKWIMPNTGFGGLSMVFPFLSQLPRLVYFHSVFSLSLLVKQCLFWRAEWHG